MLNYKSTSILNKRKKITQPKNEMFEFRWLFIKIKSDSGSLGAKTLAHFIVIGLITVFILAIIYKARI